MYIWVLGRAVPTQYNGMHGSFEFEQAQMIKKRGYKVVYVALTVSPYTIFKIKELGTKKEVVNGITTYNVYLPFGFTDFGGQWVRKASSRKLFSRVEKEEGLPDIMHVHFPSMWAYNSFECFKHREVPIVVTEHWTEVLTKSVDRYVVENLKWFVNNSKAFICVGEPLRRSVAELVGGSDAYNRIKVVPNIVNANFSFKETTVDNENFMFCAIGRLVGCKRFDLLIRAFNEAFHGDRRIHLRIVGGGNQMKTLQNLIRELEIQAQITLTDTKNREDTAKEVQNCDVLVCSSNLETFGVPVIEGMACGKPIITTDAFAMPTVIDSSVGILVEMNNFEQMIAALKKMYSTRDQYDEKHIADTAKEYFGENAVIDRLLEIYESRVNGS